MSNDTILKQVAQEARETFPERFTGKTDKEIIAEIAETVKKYAHLTFEEKYAMLTPENQKRVNDKITELVNGQKAEVQM